MFVCLLDIIRDTHMARHITSQANATRPHILHTQLQFAMKRKNSCKMFKLSRCCRPPMLMNKCQLVFVRRVYILMLNSKRSDSLHNSLITDAENRNGTRTHTARPCSDQWPRVYSTNSIQLISTKIAIQRQKPRDFLFFMNFSHTKKKSCFCNNSFVARCTITFRIYRWSPQWTLALLSRTYAFVEKTRNCAMRCVRLAIMLCDKWEKPFRHQPKFATE